MQTRLTKTAWFGPKRHLGWGWRPVAWQGWVVVIVFVGLSLASTLALSGTASAVGVVVLIALLLGIIVVTGDPPG